MWSNAEARPGGYIGIGLGGSAVNGTNVNTGYFSASNQPPGDANLLGTNLSKGASTLLNLGFNIKGYAAIETALTGHGRNITDQKNREWSAHWHSGVRVYPVWHWQQRLPEWLKPLEPSFFGGWGLSYQGYNPGTGGYNEVAWKTWKSMRLGTALEYYFPPYLKVGLDYSYIRAPYQTFIFNMSGRDSYDLNQSAVTHLHQLFLFVSLHLWKDKA